MKVTAHSRSDCTRTINRLTLASTMVVLLVGGALASAHGVETVSNLSDQPSIDGSDFYKQHWPDGRPAIYKLNDKLILAIPPQYQKFWVQDGSVVREFKSLEQLAQTKIVGFSFFLPDFSGYTPDNFRQDFDTSRVDVVSIEPADPRQADPDAPGSWPPNMIKRVLKAGVVGAPFDRYDLKCYHTVGAFPFMVTCYGMSDARHEENILLRVDLPPYIDYVKFPIMQALYFTKRYGGLQVLWRTSASNFARWREINDQVWKFIESWNIANQSSFSR